MINSNVCQTNRPWRQALRSFPLPLPLPRRRFLLPITGTPVLQAKTGRELVKFTGTILIEVTFQKKLH